MKVYHILYISIFLVSCQGSQNTHSVLTENVVLAKDFYKALIEKQKSGDSLFTFDKSKYRFDTIIIFPSYTSLEKIKSYLDETIIEEYINREMLRENEDLFLFKRKNDFLYYFSLDSLYAIPDLDNMSNSFHKDTEFKIKQFKNGQLGGYLIPLEK